MGHICGSEVFVGNKKELMEYINDDISNKQWENPRIAYPDVKILSGVAKSQDKVKEILAPICQKLHTDYIIAMQFKSNGSIDGFAKDYPEKFAKLKEKAEADLADFKNLQKAELDRLQTQKFVTCPECSSKLNSKEFTKNVPTYYFGNSRFLCDRSKYGLEQDGSFYNFEISFGDFRPFKCPVCGKTTIGGKTYLTKVDRLIKKHQQNVEKLYQAVSKQKGRTVWLVESCHYVG